MFDGSGGRRAMHRRRKAWTKAATRRGGMGGEMGMVMGMAGMSEMGMFAGGGMKMGPGRMGWRNGNFF